MSTKSEWESYRVDSDDPPENDELLEFFQKQCKLLSRKTAESDKPAQVQSQGLSTNKPSSKKATFSHVATQAPMSPLCNEPHFLYVCQALLKMPIQSRIDEIRESQRCSIRLDTTNRVVDAHQVFHNIFPLSKNIQNIDFSLNFFYKLICKLICNYFPIQHL